MIKNPMISQLIFDDPQNVEKPLQWDSLADSLSFDCKHSKLKFQNKFFSSVRDIPQIHLLLGNLAAKNHL